MKFVDELDIYAKAGDGGAGVVRWRREKFMQFGGPSGGNGGNGGDVYLRAVKNLGLLSKYTGDNQFIAADGTPGDNKSRHGKGSNDVYIDVPVGSTVTDIGRGRVYELLKEGETEIILRGGRGGLGNEYFKSSTNRSPEQSTPGTAGEVGNFKIELSLLVDVGLIGLPNAGKSTLLNSFTNATSEIGAYPFTTKEPHLGDLYGFILADIPGLIEGAAEGKGLGHKFLKHVKKTKMLLHLVSLESLDPVTEYTKIRNELAVFDPSIPEKEEWIILTKSDLVSDDDAAKFASLFDKFNKRVFVISANTGSGTKELRDALVTTLREQD